jgi:hypothetical protein
MREHFGADVLPKNSWMDRDMWEDPIVEEVHRTRETLAAEHKFDVKAIFADLRKRQAALGARLVRRKKRDTSTAEGDRAGPIVSGDSTFTKPSPAGQ